MAERPVDQFIKRVGVATGALIAVASVISWIWSTAFGIAIDPVLDALAAERSSRIHADEQLARQLENLSQDRLDLIDVMLTTQGQARDKKLMTIRARWARER